MTFSGFEPRSYGKQDCNDEQVTGAPSTIFSYIAKHSNDDSDDDIDLDLTIPTCDQYYHSTAQIDRLKINTDITGSGDITITGDITGASVQDTGGNVLSAKKDFDIPHPTKEGWRLRHVCLEGPEAGVYVRGRLTGRSYIDLPPYWKGLVDPETITVTLTQIGSSQDLIVDGVEWGSRVKVRSGNASKIDCYYFIQGERKDGEKLIAEYEGTTIEDYPGNNEEYTHNK